MVRRRRLTDAGVKALKPKATRFAYPDPECSGHYVRCHPTGVKTYVAVARDPRFAKQVWASIGSTDHLTIDEAREKARAAIKRIKLGQSAFEPPPPKPDSFKNVAENWFKRHVQKKKLRSADEIRRVLEKYVYKLWAEREFAGIGRQDVSRLLDHVEDNNGARQADMVLSVLSGICNWHTARVDHYASPIVRGMRRSEAKPRERILNDDELRLVWKQAESNGRFGAIVRLALLTAQRREKLVTMKWSDVSDGTWNIHSEKGEKGSAGSLVLPEVAVEIIQAQPCFASNPYVFAAAHGNECFSSFGDAKARFDAALPEMPRWTIHDLRRTARSLMSRAGVQADIAERVLGHVIGGVRGIYDQHDYTEEKAAALRKLAEVIDTIINPPPAITNPPPDNVVTLRQKA